MLEIHKEKVRALVKHKQYKKVRKGIKHIVLGIK